MGWSDPGPDWVKKPKKKKKEVAGPYRSQSRNPKIRKQATKSEHRKVVVKAKPKSSSITQPVSSKFSKGYSNKSKVGNPDGGIPIGKILDYLRNPNEKITGDSPGRKFVEDEAKTALKAVKDSLERAKSGEGHLRTPSSAQLQTALTAGSLAGGGAGVKAGEKTALKAVDAASDASWAKNAVKAVAKGAKEAPKRKVAKIKTAPKRAATKVKETPARVRTAPARAKKAATTSEGRRAVAKGTGRKAAQHPLASFGGAGVVANQSGTDIPGLKQAGALVEGTYDALRNEPKETLETTAHGLLGTFTAPLAIGGAAVESVKQGSTKPLRHEIRDLAYVPEDKTGTGRPGGIAGMAQSLLSGDPKTVEETTREESGITPYIPVPHLIRRAKGTRAYTGPRGALRKGVETKRAARRAKATATARATAESGGFVSKKAAKKVKHSVADSSRPGEYYVNRALGRFVERQRSRHYVSREDARMREGEMAGRTASAKVARKLRKGKGTSQSEFNDAEVVRILGKHGIPLNEKGYAYVKMIHDGWQPWEFGDTPLKGVKLDRHATKYALDHPELFQGGKRTTALKETLGELERQSEAIGGHSPRNRYQAQVDNVINPLREKEGLPPRLKPEEMVTPGALKLLPKKGSEWTRAEALDFIISREGDVRTLRQSGQFAAAKALEREQKALLEEMKGLMRPPEHGGAEGGVSTTRAVAWTPEMEARFVKQVRADNKRFGLYEPTPYLADRLPKGLEQDQVAPNFRRDIPINKIWPSRGIAARSGNAISDLESTLLNSLELPLQRKATVRGFNRIIDNISRKVEGKRVFTRRQAEKAANRGEVPDGTIFIRRQALRGLLERSDQMEPEAFAAAVAREVEIGQKLSAGEEIVSALKAADDMGIKGEKVVPVDAVAMHELMGHLNGVQGISRTAGRATNFASRAILNSPAFELAQFAQEGIPMAAALARDVVNVPKAIASVKRISELPPEIQAQIRAVAGASSGLEGIPTQAALRSDGFLNPARVAARPKAWQTAWRIVNGSALGRFDRARAGMMREAAAIAKVEGDFRRAEKGFTLWRTSANNLFKDMDWAVKKMEGMTPEERIAFVASHPKLGDRLQKHMNGMAGNWNSFTVFEKHIAPLSVFYAFQRFSVLWVLYHFPLDHPVVSTALAMAGEVNAQELKKIAEEHGGTPSVLDYTKPVVNGETVLPAGSRFSPVLGSPAQAVLEGRPTALLGAAPPWATIPLEATTGQNFYTGQPTGENGWLYMLRQTGSLSPLSRFLGLPDLGKSKSPGAQAFEETDPLRSERSFLLPYIGQTADQFGEEKKLEQAYKDKYGEGDIPGPFDSKLVQELLFGNNGRPKPEMLNEVIDAIHKSEKASEYIKGKQAKFLPSSDFSDLQKELLKAVEDAWETGPNSPKKKGESSGGQYSSSSGQYSSGGGQYSPSTGQYSGGGGQYSP